MTTVNSLLSSDHVSAFPKTQSVKYAGSKLKLLPSIFRLVKKTGAQSILDAFSGSTRVSQFFAQCGYRVISNDIAVWSKVIGTCYLQNQKERKTYTELIEHLNLVKSRDGWFTEHYGGEPNGGCSVQKDGTKRPWQIHNTRKLDGIREEIDCLQLSSVERSIAITSLLLSLDKVDNTLGHFVSYLRNWSQRSYRRMVLEVPDLFVSDNEHQVVQGDVFNIIDQKVDLAYFDPPYGSNNDKMPPSRVRYDAYYHLLKTICLNDKPELFGKVKRRKDSSDKISSSVFEEFRKNPKTDQFFAVEAIERLIQSTASKWILLSYSSGGRATAQELNTVLSNNGDIVDVIKIDYKRNVMAEMKWTHEWIEDNQSKHREFLFLIDTG